MTEGFEDEGRDDDIDARLSDIEIEGAIEKLSRRADAWADGTLGDPLREALYDHSLRDLRRGKEKPSRARAANLLLLSAVQEQRVSNLLKVAEMLEGTDDGGPDGVHMSFFAEALALMSVHSEAARDHLARLGIESDGAGKAS